MARGTALVTGASTGLGAEFAKLCAAGGYDVVLVARSAQRLSDLAANLAKTYGVSAHPFPADLADREAPPRIFAQASPAGVDILINNAGFGLRGPFAETGWGRDADLMQVNMVALAHLTKLFVPGMIARRSGRILNIASTAAFLPGPFMALYYASKAFVLSFSEALSNELEGTGVTATVLCPGPTRTEFAAAAGIADSQLFKGPVMSAAEVAQIGYDAMMAGKSSVIAGARNLWMIRGTRLVSRSFTAREARKRNWNK
jgi:short-subunit dehydrogenase